MPEIELDEVTVIGTLYGKYASQIGSNPERCQTSRVFFFHVDEWTGLEKL